MKKSNSVRNMDAERDSKKLDWFLAVIFGSIVFVVLMSIAIFADQYKESRSFWYPVGEVEIYCGPSMIHGYKMEHGFEHTVIYKQKETGGEIKIDSGCIVVSVSKFPVLEDVGLGGLTELQKSFIDKEGGQ